MKRESAIGELNEEAHLLPSSLLFARRWRDRTYPVYAKLERDNIELALRLIQTYKEHIKTKKSALKEAIGSLEDLGYDYRYVRGLSALLERRCIFSSNVKADSTAIRRKVFQIANEIGLPTSPEQRLQVIQQASSELKITVKELEESIYADLEDELTLKSFITIEPEQLLKQYNLSLTQTLLFYSTEMRFTASGNWQRIFRAIKRLGLIYEAQIHENECLVKVDGPISLFKLNSRYGTNMAKLLPEIIANEKWRLEAKIQRRREYQILNFKLSSLKYGMLMKAIPPVKPETYDSQIEQSFAARFNVLNTGWQLKREPEPIPTGKYVMIPDFVFRKGGVQVYMEVVGFWTEEYLRHKIEKLGMIKDLDMIVAVDQELACHKMDRVAEKLNVFYFKTKIPLKPVLSYLKEAERKLKEVQTKRIKSMPIKLSEPVVDIRELAKKLGVLEEAAREILKERQVPGYLLLSDILIKESKLEEIKNKLKEQLRKEELNLVDASSLIEEMGGKKPIEIIEALGYRIEWHGIDPKASKIKKS